MFDIHICACVYMRTHARARARVCVCVCVCMCACMWPAHVLCTYYTCSNSFKLLFSFVSSLMNTMWGKPETSMITLRSLNSSHRSFYGQSRSMHIAHIDNISDLETRCFETLLRASILPMNIIITLFHEAKAFDRVWGYVESHSAISSIKW